MTNLSVLTEISQLAAQAFVAGIWQGGLLLGAVAVALRLLPRLSPSIRFSVWAFAFSAMVAIPLLHLSAFAPVAQRAGHQVFHLSASWAAGIAICWSLLFAFRLGRLMLQAMRLRKTWKAASPLISHPETLSLLEGLPRSPQLCTSADVDAPSVIGFLSPRLLLPECLIPTLSERELQQIVLHECEHLRRHDDWINLLQKIALALFPLNPALHLADHRLSLERELACDASVVASTAAPLDYAGCLLRLAEHRILSRRVALALSAWESKSELGRRVHRLLQPRVTMCPLAMRISAIAICLALAGGAFEIARVPGLVSFADPLTSPATDSSSAALSSPSTTQPVGRVLPVVYHVPPSSPAAWPNDASKARHPRRATRLSVPLHGPSHRVESHAPSMVPHLVLTSASQPARMPPTRRLTRAAAQEVYAVWTESSPSFAAVPFGDGWLVIQL